MNDIYKHAENPIFYSKRQSEEELDARRKDDQTNSYLNGFIAIIGVVGFFGSIFILNGQYGHDEQPGYSGGSLCVAAMANAGISYHEKESTAKLVVSTERTTGVSVIFTVECAKKYPSKICFGDGTQAVLDDHTCSHTYTLPGKFSVKVQQCRAGKWRTISTEIIEISDIREAGLLGYSKYH